MRKRLIGVVGFIILLNLCFWGLVVWALIKFIFGGGV